MGLFPVLGAACVDVLPSCLPNTRGRASRAPHTALSPGPPAPGKQLPSSLRTVQPPPCLPVVGLLLASAASAALLSACAALSVRLLVASLRNCPPSPDVQGLGTPCSCFLGVRSREVVVSVWSLSLHLVWKAIVPSRSLIGVSTHSLISSFWNVIP